MCTFKEKLKGSWIFKVHKTLLICFENIKGIFQRQPAEIRRLKNYYLGKRIFIVLTGPSLTIDNLNLLKDEYSLSVNSIVKTFDMTTWRPSFYMMSDKIPYDKFAKLVNKNDFDKVFYPNDLNCSEKDVFYFSRNKAQRYKALRDGKFVGVLYPTEKPEKYFNDAESVSFLAIQLAVYLGFKEIYLLGQDCNFSSTTQHSDIADPGYDITIPKQTGQILIDIFKNYKELYEKLGVKIYNCTRGGMLEVFERKNLEDVLANK